MKAVGACVCAAVCVLCASRAGSAGRESAAVAKATAVNASKPPPAAGLLGGTRLARAEKGQPQGRPAAAVKPDPVAAKKKAETILRARELAEAIRKKQVERVGDILKAHPRLIEEHPGVVGWMETAARSEAPPEVFRALIEAGCSVNRCALSSEPLVEWMVGSTKCGPAQYKVLLESGATIGRALEMVEFCEAGERDKVREVLLQHIDALPFLVRAHGVSLAQPGWGYRMKVPELTGPADKLWLYLEVENRRPVMEDQKVACEMQLAGPVRVSGPMAFLIAAGQKQLAHAAWAYYRPAFPPGRYHYTVSMAGRFIVNDWFTLR